MVKGENLNRIGPSVRLFISSARGPWRSRQPERQKSSQGSRAKTALWLVFAAITIALVILLLPYKTLTPTGPYSVASVQDTYIDDNRVEQYSSTGEYRRVNVVFWYPENAEDGKTYPLVVFSHGGLGTETSNQSLYLELASHGYVVCSIGHPYHAFWTKGEDGRITLVSREYFSEIMQENAKSDKLQSVRYYQEWMEIRTADIQLVIDVIHAKVAGGTEGVYALVDSARIGLIGHSLGGSAALAIPRQRDDIKAVIALESPFLYDIIGVENDNFIWLDKVYPVPVLNIYSDSSWDHLSEWAQYERNHEFLSDTPENIFNLYMPGRGHYSLSDLSLASPLLVRLLERGKPNQDSREYLNSVNKACLAFFDSYLDHPNAYSAAKFHPKE